MFVDTVVEDKALHKPAFLVGLSVTVLAFSLPLISPTLSVVNFLVQSLETLKKVVFLEDL